MAERDYLAATRERVVVFDGGMGATLEQFDLTQEDYGGLLGKCHEALVLNRPDVIEGVHTSMLEAGAESYDLTSVRVWGAGADVMPSDLAQRFKRMGASVSLPLVGSFYRQTFEDYFGTAGAVGEIFADDPDSKVIRPLHPRVALYAGSLAVARDVLAGDPDLRDDRGDDPARRPATRGRGPKSVNRASERMRWCPRSSRPGGSSARCRPRRRLR